MIVLMVVAIMVGFIGIASAVVYAQANLSFISQDQENALNILMYKIPFTPKTPKQILLVASQMESIITKYNPEFSLSGTVSNTSVPLATFDFKVEGPINISPEKTPVFDLALDGGVSFGGTSYQASGKIRKKDETIYGKVDSLSDSIIDLYNQFSSGGFLAAQDESAVQSARAEIAANLKTVFENWVTYDVSTVESEARAELTKRSADQSLIDTTRRDAQRVLLEKSVLDKIERLPDDQVDSIGTYHLRYAPDQTSMKDTLRIVYAIAKERDPDTTTLSDEELETSLDTIAKSVRKLSVDVWFGKHDAILRKASIQIDIVFPELTDYFANTSYYDSGVEGMIASQVADITLSTSMVLTIRDIGKDIDVVVPSPLVSTQDYGNLLVNALKTEKQRQAEALEVQYDQDFRTLGNALTLYYAKYFEFPALLTQLNDEGMISSSSSGMWMVGVDNQMAPSPQPPAATGSVVDRLSQYTYQRSSNGREYILYVQRVDPYGYSSYTLPLYGITSEYSYPRQLTTDDLKLVQPIDPASVLPTPSPTIDTYQAVQGIMDRILR